MFPAYAGMIPGRRCEAFTDDRVPRIRGDDPTMLNIDMMVIKCSPHTRG